MFKSRHLMSNSFRGFEQPSKFQASNVVHLVPKGEAIDQPWRASTEATGNLLVEHVSKQGTPCGVHLQDFNQELSILRGLLF